MESTALFDVLVNQSENGIFYLENDILIYANHAFTEVLNISNQKIQGESILHLLTGDNKKLMEYAISKLQRGEYEKFKNDFSFEDEKGTVTYYSIQLKIQSRTADKLTIIGSSNDVTERVLKNKEAQDSKAMFDALYGHIVDGIMVYDYNKEKITDCNEAAIKIFGYKTKQEFQQKSRFQLRKLETRYREIVDNSHEGIVYMDASTFLPIMCNKQSLRLFGVASFEEFYALNPNEYLVDGFIEEMKPIEFYAAKMREAVQKGYAEAVCYCLIHA